jgi:ABC-type multidrug transport system ATPase subunit
VFVSTHLITEFEGLIDEFTIMDAGREVVRMNADEAREKYQKIRARFASDVPKLDLPGALSSRVRGRELEVIVNGGGPAILEQLRARSPEELRTESLSLEEIFTVTLR